MRRSASDSYIEDEEWLLRTSPGPCWYPKSEEGNKATWSFLLLMLHESATCARKNERSCQQTRRAILGLIVWGLD